MQFHFLTLFPEIFPPVLSSSLMGKAQAKGLVQCQVTDVRDFATDKHQKADDTPYGGGEGMVMKADVLYAAWDHAMKSAMAKEQPARTATIFMSPQGKTLTQALAKDLAQFDRLIFVCGHYEGIDERFIERCVDHEISIGDYVLTGGELPALVVADTISRLVSGVVGNADSVSKDSFENGLLKYPQYTKPREFEGLTVPDILLSGDHKKIAQWRQAQMEERTKKKRPDLWAEYAKKKR